MNNNINTNLFDFLKKSPSVFHVISNIKDSLQSAGFEELREAKEWSLSPGGKYFITRNDSSIIAFSIPDESFHGFQIVASHSDSPTFKIKEVSEMDGDKHYTRLNVEPYGGMIYAPWMDRPLSIAGRVIVKDNNTLRSELIHIDRDLLMIPNLAIHMNRKINEGYIYNVQKDLIPLFGSGLSEDSFITLIAKTINVSKEDIVGKDLYLFNRTEGTIIGANNEFIAAPRLDDLQCVFASLQGFLDANPISNIPVYCVFDNEEVGSHTKQGAASPFLKDTLKRVCFTLGQTEADYQRYLANSFMVSADNAHAVHPNLPDKSDAGNRVYMNEGIVIKHNANQKYTTDAISNGIFTSICQKANIPTQSYANRSDIPGGSTLGNIANTQTSMNTVDIGLAQLAMHSPYETAGAKDTEYLYEALKAFYSTMIRCDIDGIYHLDYL
ncbi:M18 family aminopeptidase [Lachnospiraceae bacterium OttesenSCG-928-E19]|nr:M18 family aminopeptidase [Lachnospiraceae bacterium OttesenSCG-928-E19]